MYERVVKRIIDIVLSALGLILLSWLYLIISIAILIDDPGPIFFTQKRIGRNKTIFIGNKLGTVGITKYRACSTA